MYKRPEDDIPLHPIQEGLGACNSSAIYNASIHVNGTDLCGGVERGSCVKRRCKCNEGWVGPHCQARKGFDDIDWEYSEKIQFHGPSRLICFVSVWWW